MQPRQQAFSDAILSYNKEFKFDWNDVKTFAASKQLYKEIENFYKDNSDLLATLPQFLKKDFAQLSYKLGTYANHITRDPNKALEYYQSAMSFANKDNWYWINTHIAFCYQQLMFASNKKFETEKVNQYKSLASNYLPNIEELPNNPKLVGFIHCVDALIHYEAKDLKAAEQLYAKALELYEKNDLRDLQYLRAKNRYLQILAEEKEITKAHSGFVSLEAEWQDFFEKNGMDFNPYIGRFYLTYAEFLLQQNQDNKFCDEILQKYKKAYAYLEISEGSEAGICKEIQQKIADLQMKFSLEASLAAINKELLKLPFSARENLIENLCSIYLSGLVPMSGATLLQKNNVDNAVIDDLNATLEKNKAYRNTQSEPKFVYQFAREASSGGVIPAFMNRDGDILIGMICNGRNPDMYNVCAGYTEAPYPAWRGELLVQNEKLAYDRAKIKTSATQTMLNTLAQAKGDWSKVDYSDGEAFRNDFVVNNVKMPKTDMNALDTATRECLEEMSLNLKDFPNRKIFLCSHDNTIGISQGDAPGQVSNKNDLFFIFLGKLEQAPAIKAGDDVVIADWVNIKNIKRESATNYSANGKPLCIYMLRGVETGLKQLWDYLISEKSKYYSYYTNKEISRFHSPSGLATFLENYCDEHQISISGTPVQDFLRYLTKRHVETRTGEDAVRGLKLILEVTDFLKQSPKPTEFVDKFPKLLNEQKVHPKIDLSTLFRNTPHLTTQKQLEQEKQELLTKKLFG